MKQWTRWSLITVTVLPIVCALVNHARERMQRQQSLETQSPVLYESSAESKGVAARMTAKYRIADEVIAGRLPLLQAAAAFRSLDERWPRAADLCSGCPNTAPEAEVYCLKVIAYVDAEAPHRGSELTRRLHKELEAMLRNGTLHLPESGDALVSTGG
jgi:hypothetical protein